MTVQLVVDSTRCDGHGICALLAPGLVSLDPWGYASASGPATGRRALRMARRAAAACPARALVVVEVADGAALRA